MLHQCYDKKCVDLPPLFVLYVVLINCRSLSPSTATMAYGKICMIQNNLLESETALFSKKGGKKQRHSIERWTLSSVFDSLVSSDHFRTHFVPTFFTQNSLAEGLFYR